MDTEFGQWNLDPTTDCQVRDVKYRISLGPKTIRTEEHQVNEALGIFSPMNIFIYCVGFCS